MFVKLFISKWRHPDAKIRINAVTKLNPSKSSDAKKLWLLAKHDPDQDVRIAAILRLDESNKLSFNQLQPLDSSIITLLLCASTNADLHSYFISSIKEQYQLAHLAMHSTLAATRQQAVRKLHDDLLTNKVLSYAKVHDKVVYRIIRDQQKLKQQQLAEHQAALCQCNDLIQQISDLTTAQYDRHMIVRFEHLIQQWKTLSHLATDEQHLTFRNLQQQLEQRLKSMKLQELADAEKKTRQQALNKQIQTIEEVINQHLNTLSTLNQEQLKQYHDEIELITQQPLNPSQLHRCQQLKQLFECLSTVMTQANTLTFLQERTEKITSIEECNWCLDQANLHYQAFKNWPNNFTPHPQSASVNQLISSLQLKRKQLKEQLKEASEREKQQQRDALVEKELLCIAMEALIDLNLPPNEKAQHVRTLQQQWKAVDQTVTVSVKNLWDRFHKASKEAYAPCEQYFREQSRIRTWNLKQREQICQLIESYYASLDWSDLDWNAIESVLKKAKVEWREFSPVDRAPGKLLQERFNSLLERADNALNNYRQECAIAKQAIVEEASYLAASDEANFAAATHRFKELQSTWKEIGSTEHKRERQLWKAFREQGDLLFSRLRSHQQHQRSQKELAARLLCVRLEILLNQPSPESDQYLRMEYQMERLEKALEKPSAEEQNIELTNIVSQWQEEGYGEHYPDLDERIHQLLDQH